MIAAAANAACAVDAYGVSDILCCVLCFPPVICDIFVLSCTPLKCGPFLDVVEKSRI